MAYPNHETNESAEFIRRSFVCDVLSARNAHRTAQRLSAQGFPGHYAEQAKALRDAALRGARRNLDRYTAAVAKVSA